MRIAIEPVYDEFGGMYPYIEGIKKYSSFPVREVPCWIMRKFLNRNRSLKISYNNLRLKYGLKGFEVLHSMADPWFMELAKRSKANGCKWAHTYHLMFFEEDYDGGLAPWQKDINRYLVEEASNADIKIATSNWFHKYLFEKYSIETDIVMGGIDVKLCRKADGNKFTKSTGLRDFILFVGSIREVKDPDLFVGLAEALPDKKFVMIGPGLTPEEWKKNKDKDLPGNITALGRRKRYEVLDAMSASSAYVLTSKHEGFPQTVLEAMAIGKPVVAAPYMGYEDMIPSDEYGLIFKSGNLEELVEKTKKALSSSHIGINASKRVSGNFDWSVLAKDIDTLYKS